VEHSGPVQACNGIALPLPSPFTFYRCVEHLTTLHIARIIQEKGKAVHVHYKSAWAKNKLELIL